MALVGVAAATVVTFLANHLMGLVFQEAAKPIPGSEFTVGVDFEFEPCHAFALPTTLSSGSQAVELTTALPDRKRSITKFLRNRGGAPQATVIVKIVFTGTTDRPTRILDVKLSRVRSAPSLSGTAVYTSCRAEDITATPIAVDLEVSPIPVSIDLDRPPLEMMRGPRPYFANNELEVTVGDRETLRVRLNAKQQSYRWIFAVDYIDSGGQVAVTYLDVDGRLYANPTLVPEAAEFSLTGRAPGYSISYTEAGDTFHVKP